jgi:Fuc2NAc and GlcNAc transferase
MLSSIFWFDATLTLFRRLKNREPVISPHKKHAFHRIVQAGFSHQKTVLYAFVLNLVILVFAYSSFKINYVLLPFFLLNIALLYYVTIQIDKRKTFV